MIERQRETGVSAVPRTHDVRRRDIQRQQHRRQILGMQFGRIGLVVVYLRIGWMIAAAVDEDPIDLRELRLLSVPGSQIPQRSVDEYHGGSPAVADEAVRKPRAVERRGVERTIERVERP